MRLIIEARLEGDQASSAATEVATIVAVVERQDCSVVGLHYCPVKSRTKSTGYRWVGCDLGAIGLQGA